MSSFPKPSPNCFACISKSLIRGFIILTLVPFFNLSFSQNVGIGTQTPEDPLHVIGNMRISGGRIVFVNTGQSVFIGESAGINDNMNYTKNVFVGYEAGKLNTSGNQNISIGYQAMAFNTSGFENIGIGYNALRSNIAGNQNTAIGYLSLTNSTGNDNTALGNEAGKSVSTGHGNTFLGVYAGVNNNGNRNVFIGKEAGWDETGSDKLYIDNSITSSPLLYGDFDKNKLTINDSLSTKFFQLTNSAADGYLLKSNASGKATWTNPASIFNNVWSISGIDIYKNNTGNVGIGIVAPSEKLEIIGNIKVNAGRITFTNTSYRTLVGEGAGANSTDFDNTFIGYYSGNSTTTGDANTALGSSSLRSNVIGHSNVAIGMYALYSMTTGTQNTAVGHEALKLGTSITGSVALGYQALQINSSYDNTALGFRAGSSATGNKNVLIGTRSGQNNTGDGNIILGHEAGMNSAGSDQLIIDNTSTATPLIYGEFDKNKLTINDTLATERFYITEGAADGFLLKSNSSGRASWANPTSLFNNVWSISGNDIYKNNSGNVGIGTSTPSEKLDVVGNIEINGGRLAMVNDKLNIFIGEYVGEDIITGGNNNNAVGFAALRNTTTGTNNIAFGTDAMQTNVGGSNNVVLGNFGLKLGASVANTVAVGTSAGYNSTGSGNVFIGHNAGYSATGSDKLYIENSNSSTPLIYGDFSQNRVSVGITTSNPKSSLDVSGSVGVTFKSGIEAGTTHPDESGTIWRYNSGTGTITLPSPTTCANRMYIIINHTGATRSISNYRDLGVNIANTINTWSSIEIVSDGIEWWQVK